MKIAIVNDMFIAIEALRRVLMTIAAPKLAGSRERIAERALGPPVEEPMVIRGGSAEEERDTEEGGDGKGRGGGDLPFSLAIEAIFPSRARAAPGVP